MTIYVDPSAWLKRYLLEVDHAAYDDILVSDPRWTSARHSLVEVRRALARHLDGADLVDKRREFEEDWRRCDVVELDEATCALAADLAETAGARTLDALHLAAAQRVGGGALPFLTADIRQAQIARSLGWVVLGS